MGLLITIAVLAILFLIALKLFTVKRVVVEVMSFTTKRL